MAGLVFSLTAMGYVCGLLGLANYLLNTDKVQEFLSLQGAQGDAVKILIYFILGWLSLVLNHYKLRKQPN